MEGLSKSEVELMIIDGNKDCISRIEALPVKIATETAKLIDDKKHTCPAFWTSSDKAEWKAIVETPKRLDTHISIHKGREKWFRFAVASIIALFSVTITLMGLLLKAIQSAMSLLKLHS